MMDQHKLIENRTTEIKRLKKIGFIVINVVLLLVALALIIIGIVIQCSFYARSSNLSRYVRVPGVIALLLGLTILCVSLFAFAFVYWKKLLLLFAHIDSLIVLIGVEVALAASGFALKPFIMKLVLGTLRSEESKFTTDNLAYITWISLQFGLRCCGVDNSTEWFQYLEGSSVPDSCCLDYSIGCGSTAFNSGNIYMAGCGSALYQWIEHHQTTVAVLLPISILLKMLSVWFACAHRRVLHQFNYVSE